MKIAIERVNDKVHLQAKNEQGNIVDMDGSPEIGGEELGARPMQLVLMALGGCTSMDVLSILKTMREAVEGYKVNVEAERATEHPMVFTKAHIHYIFEGNLKKENVEIVPINIEGLNTYPGIAQWGNAKPYDPRVKDCMRIYPTELMEGFFVTKLKKLE